MKFSTEVEKLRKIITLASRLCSGNLTLPILNNVLIELKENKLFVSSTNLEIGLSFEMKIEAEKEGKISVPGKVFSDFLSSLPKEEKIQIEEKEGKLHAKCGSFKAKILGQDPSEYPVLPEMKEKPLAEIDIDLLTSSFSKVSHIVSPSDSRVEISGILIKFDKKNLKIVGTDSIRLGEKTISLPEEVKKVSVIVPQRTINEVKNIFSAFEGKIGISINPSQVGFELISDNQDQPSVKLISRLIEGSYPEYEEIIPKETKTTAVLDKEEFQKKVKIASLFSSRIQDVKLKFSPSQKEEKTGKVVISSASAEVGEMSCDIKGKVEGEALEIVFNWRYLLDGLSAIDSSEVFVGANDPNSPAILKPIGDETYLYLLMPKTI